MLIEAPAAAERPAGLAEDHPPARARRPGLPYVPALDGVRGAAVLAVLFFHAQLSWMPAGFLGVSTFFTLSGFLITALLLAERKATGTIDLRTFWVRRVRRLLPAATVCVAGVAIASRWMLDPSQLDRVRGDLVATVLYMANWRMLGIGSSYAELFSAPSPVLHFWSLAIEEQFYLVYPLLVYAVFRLAKWSRTGFSCILAGLCAASVAAPLIFSFTTDRFYYGTDARAAELLVGALLAMLVSSRRASSALAQSRAVERVVGWAGTLALVVLVATWASVHQGSEPLYRGGFFAYALVSAALIAGALMPPGVSPVARVLQAWPLRTLGKISYGVYVYHWPIYLWLSPERTGLGIATNTVLRIGVTLAVATVSYLLVERPVRQAGYLRSGTALLAIPATALCLSLVAVLAVPAGVPANAAITFGDADQPPPAPEFASAPEAGPPAPATQRAPLRVLAVGTSRATDFAAKLAGWASFFGQGIEVTPAVADCGKTRKGIGIEFHTEETTCAGWVDAWTPALQSVRPDVVVVLQPLNHTTLPAWGEHIFNPEAAAVVDLLTSGGAKLLPVTLPGAGLDEVNTLIRHVADNQGVNIGALDALDPSDPVGTVGHRLEELRPAEATEPPGRSTKVMIVGDSVASNLGKALEQWAKKDGTVTVWNAAKLGCGLAAGGVTNAQPPHNRDSAECTSWRASWPGKIAEFDPDIVVVVNSAWDLPARSLPEWGALRSIGDPVFDAWLLGQYQAAADVFTSRGARLVWVTLPCTGNVWAGFAIADTGAFDNARIAQLNTRLLAGVKGVSIVDLNGHVCPGGVFDPKVGGIERSRPDGLHFSDDAARYVADWLGPQILSAAGHRPGTVPLAPTGETPGPAGTVGTAAPSNAGTAAGPG